jgi:hypothetical protein
MTLSLLMPALALCAKNAIYVAFGDQVDLHVFNLFSNYFCAAASCLEILACPALSFYVSIMRFS